MAITLRKVKGTELTYEEADQNFASLFYSASISGNDITFYCSGSTHTPAPSPLVVTLPNVEGTRWTSSLDGSISRNSNVLVTGSLKVTSDITGSSFRKIGGTSTQVLVADGTILTAGTNVTISGGTISSTDTTYSAGTGITLTGTTFSLTAQPLHYKKMVPYTVVEYYGSLNNFDASGAGLGDWINIYLCNGSNGTPDKRGVVGVGVSDGTMRGGTLPASTAPGNGNPTYTFNTITGTNTVTLTTTQLPAHDHAGSTAVSTTSAHYHLMFEGNQVGYIGDPTSTTYVAGSARSSTNSQNYSTQRSLNNNPASVGKTSDASTTTTTTLTIASQGGGEAHSNYQPGLGCYYIMYIPA